MVKMDLCVVFANTQYFRDFRERQLCVDPKRQYLSLTFGELEDGRPREPLSFGPLQSLQRGWEASGSPVQRLHRGALPPTLLPSVIFSQVDDYPQKPGAEGDVPTSPEPSQGAARRLKRLEKRALREVARVVGVGGVSANNVEDEVLVAPYQLTESGFIPGHERAAQLGVARLIRRRAMDQPQ